MKNETTRTKTQTGFSSRAIALVLCFVMLLTAIGSGSVLSAIAVAAEGSGAAELVDAAKAGADVNAPAPGEAEESSDVLEPEDIDDGFVLSKKDDSDIAATGWTPLNDGTYYVWGATAASNTNEACGAAASSATYKTTLTISDGTGSFSVNTGQSSGYYVFFLSDSNTIISGTVSDNQVDTTGISNCNGGQGNHDSKYFFWFGGTYCPFNATLSYSKNAQKFTVTDDGGSAGGGGGGGGGEATVSGGTAVSDADLLSVLRNQKVMFYAGLSSAYDEDGGVYLYTSSITGSGHNKTPAANHSYTITKTLDSKSFYLYPFTIAANTYYLGEDDWAPRGCAMSAGGTYVIHDAEITATGFTLAYEHDYSSTRIYSYDAGSTKTVATTCDADIEIGSTLSVSSGTPGVSSLGSTNTIKYYITAGDTITSSSTFNEFTITDGKIDTSAFTAGTYTLVTVLNDGTISVVADTDTFTVSLIPLATPTITLDTATGSNTSTQTASPTLTSTVTVTNTDEIDYISGTIFKLYRSTDSGSTYSLVDSNTSGTFSVARNTTTAGVYKVIASPGASDTTHSDSADSNTPTLAINRVSIATVPTISVDKTEVKIGEKIKLTVTNANSFDSDIYNLVVYKNKDGNAAATAPFAVTGTVMTSSTYINVATSDAVSAGSNDHAHYYVVAEAKDDTIYEDSTYSSVETVWIQIARYWFTGGLGDGDTWGTGSQSGNNKAADQYFATNTFYHKYTAGALSGDKYFRIVSESSNYGTDSTTNDVAVGAYSSSNNMYNTLSGGTKAMTMNFDITKSYYMFVHQRVGDTPQFYYSTNLAEVTVTPKYLAMNHTTGEYESAAIDTTGAYLYTPTEFTLVSSGGTLTLTATVTNPAYEFVGWFDDDDIDSATLLSSNLSFTTEAISSDTTYYPVVREIVTRHNVTVKTNNARLGSGSVSTTTPIEGQTVTVTVAPNTGDLSAITVTDGSGNSVETSGSGTTYTFTMPASDVRVNLTFAEASGTSNFYYNGYDTSGQPLSGFFGQQMSLAKVGGQEYSYYHVEGRSGLDHLFTVSYGNIDYTNTYVYFQVPDDWDDKTWWEGNNQYAYFMTSDEVMVQDWTKMTADGTKNSKHQYKIAVPDGARYVFFKEGKTGGAGDPQTVKIDLNTSENGNCNAWYLSTGTTDGKYNVTGFYNDDYLNTVGNMYENYNGTGKYTNNFKTSGFTGHNATRGGSHSYSKPNSLSTNSNDYYIIVLYKGKEYTINGETHTIADDKDPEIIWMKELPGAEDIDSSEVTVYGKDGSVVIDWNNKTSSGASDTSGTAYGFGVIADTKLYDSDGSTPIGTAHTDDGNDYESAKVVVTSEDSANIVVKTTIASDYRSKYYLKGWNINGVTYACGDNVKGVNGENADSDGVYTMIYTIPAGTEDSAKIEITPIYYLTSSYKTTNTIETVTFFLEGYSTIAEKWGDTPYIYPFYGNLNNVDNSFGVYPGQPMVFAAGQYSVEVPVNKNVPIAKTPGSTAVKGITINNGYADHVHRNLVYKWSDHDNDADHKQTYDYDDFYKIYEECLTDASGNPAGHPNSIIFRIHDEETVFNRSQYGGGKSGQFASGTNGIDISTIATSGNGWELLTNRYGQAINLFGAHVTDPTTETATTDTDNALYIVSTGYNANIAGDYGTMWKIYDGSGQLISNAGGRVGVPPSVLLLRGNSSGYASEVDALNYPSADRSVDGVGSYKDSIDDYEAIYKALHDSSYTGKRVYITYEKDAQDTRKVTSGTGANRLDGRWYYTHSSDKVKSTIGIEYWDNSQNKWVTDTMDGITGSHTTCTAKFTDNNTTTSNEYLISSGNKYNFTATHDTGWKFDSWQIKYSDTSYDPIDTAETASMPATASYEIVARFVPIDSGSLTINHTINTASSGEGTVDMAVNVYTDSTLTTKVSEFTEKSGTRVYLDDTYINNNNSYYVKIELKTTPKYDGKVSEFTYDKFNSDNSIIATDTSPGSENTLTTSTFSFPVSALYNVGTQKTKVLNYTSLIDETLHYYNFVYNLTTRGNVGKTYTSKGVLNKTDYKKVVSDQATHTLDNSILVDKAPFESNFLKSNTLSKGSISYNDETHTYTATSTFNQSDAVPKYHVVFKLPYEYLNAGDSSATPKTKKYTVTGAKAYNNNTATFDLLAEYNTFVTVNATSSSIGTQENVNKVTDGSDINHAGNNFITAPEELDDSGTPMYFKYWDVKKLKADGSAGDDVAKIYYPDFHYRVYSDYYVEAVYSNVAAESWKHNYSEDDNKDVNCSVLYLGDSRNQWNDGSKADGYTSNDAADAADLIYSDFIFHYTYMGQEIKDSTDNIEVGMILERATYIDTTDSNKLKWLTGSSSVNDMSYYRANYGGTGEKSTEAARKTAIETALAAGTALPSGTIKTAWEKSELNNKNFTEQSYKAYSQYGQTVANNTITFSKDNVIDNYVYRAYAYIKDTNGYTLSDPVYFSMRYTSNLKYAE